LTATGFNEAAADAAEFWPEVVAAGPRRRGFNEAAADAAEFFADDRRAGLTEEVASMRPRQMPRNFAAWRARSRSARTGFNEAAADAAEFSRIGHHDMQRRALLQ